MTLFWRHYQTLLKTYLFPYWSWLGLLVFLLFATLALSLLNPQLLSRFIDTVASGNVAQPLLLLALLYLVVAVLKQVVSIAETYAAENLGMLATNRLRADLMAHCLRLDLDFHTQHTPGELIERVDGDVGLLSNFFSRFVTALVGNGLLAVGVIVMLFVTEWRVGALVLLLTLGGLVVAMARRATTAAHWTVAREASAALFGFLEERLMGTEDVRSSGATAYMLRGLAERSRHLLRTFRRASLSNFLSFGAPISILFALVNGAVLLASVYLFGTHAISIGTAYLLFSYSNLLRDPIDQVMRQISDLQQVTGCMSRIFTLLDVQPTVPEGNQTELPSGPLAVEFQDVVFGYSEDVLVLQNISFVLRPGEVLGLLGRTGSGKSTITKLVTRLCDPLEGRVCLAGTDLRALSFDAARPRIGMVTQDVHVLNATVRNNLTLFDKSIPDTQIVLALEQLGLGAWYASLPEGLDTELAPGGVGLSAGEAQLLAFARVFLRNPDLVILDEASARLDPATERRLERAIDTLLNGRTAIIIAHRLATVQRVDTIMILENGQCCEYGSREVLAAARDSRFARLMRVGLEEDIPTQAESLIPSIARAEESSI